MKKCLQILAFITFYFINWNLNAQELFLNNEAETDLVFEPNDKKAIFYNLIGTNINLYQADVEVKLPEGWKLLTSTTIKTLLIGEHQEPFFTFQVSDRAKAGQHYISILLKEKGKVVQNFKIELKVKEVRNINVLALEKPKYIEEKPVETIMYLIRNTGNTEEKIFLTSKGKIIGDGEFNLLVGQSRQVSVAYALPFGLGNINKVSFDLDVRIRNEMKDFGYNFSVPYLAKTNKKSDPFHRFPIEIGFMSNTLRSSEENVSAIQFDINGKGFLDIKNKHKLEFIARGPDRFNLPRFGNVDQYFISYESKIGRIALGDNNFSASQLIDLNRFAKGIEIGKKFGKWDVSAQHSNPRFFNDIKRGTGLKGEYKINDEKLLRFNLYNKDHIYADEALITNFASAGITLNKQKYQLDSEASLSLTNSRLSGGVFNNFFLNLENFKVNSNLIYTGKEYHGFYNNSIFTNNIVTYKFASKFNISAFQNLSQINPSLDTFYYLVAPYSYNTGFEVAYLPSRRHSFRVNINRGGREDRMEVKKFHFNEDLVRYFYRGEFAKFNINFDGDFGETENLLESLDGLRKANQFRNRINLNYRPMRNMNIGGFAEHLQTSRFSTTTDQTKFLFYGIQSNISIKNRFDMSLFYRNSYAPDELFQSQSFFDFSASYRVKQHELSIVSSYAFIPQPAAEKNLFVTLKYTFRLNTPLQKKRDLGHIRGSINGIQKAGLVLNLNGDKILTDSSGSFTFHDLEPGKYLLNVNKSSIGFGNIVSGNAPIYVNVEANKTGSVEILIVKTGGIQGKVIAYDKEEDHTAFLSNIVVEVYKDQFSKLTSTNKFGEFNFSELEEGDYALKIKSEELSKNFMIQNTSSQLTVKKGEDASFTFLLEPKKKKIEFQKETVILTNSKNK